MFYITLLSCSVIWIGIWFTSIRPKYKPKAVKTVKKSDALSMPSKALVKKYNSIPADNRPVVDIVALLKALDIKYDRINVNKHFANYDSSNNVQWQCICRRKYGSMRNCRRFPEYHEMLDEFEGISAALAEREHALAVQGVATDLNMVQDFTARLRAERELISDVTKELM